ncbi:hypothetical protein JTE90_013602 [Oedothorax gibbosus]|uniref:Uncharacterized protein n=1 Tax=Oedothorax gibbosus TaxID=931172 RepID=A0AAV6VGD2_9ARAC|nr:hypothetical protein JTE90_013602 [Oedothorax gibbosus]
MNTVLSNRLEGCLVYTRSQGVRDQGKNVFFLGEILRQPVRLRSESETEYESAWDGERKVRTLGTGLATGFGEG